MFREKKNRFSLVVWGDCAKRLAEHLRERPTLPARPDDPERSLTEVDLPIRLPLFSCPFRGCVFNTDDEAEYDEHVASRTRAFPHHCVIAETCNPHLAYIDAKDFVHRAVSIREQNQIPLIGPATTRRALRTLTTRYNDENIQALCCFICGQIHTTMAGPLTSTGDRRRDISTYNAY